MTDAAGLVEEIIAEAPPVASTARNALQSAAVYAIGGSLPRAISLLTLPIYTRILAPAQYGTFALLLTIASGVTILFSVGMESVFMRVYFQLAADEDRRASLVSSVWLGLTTLPLAAGTVVGLVALAFIPSSSRFSGLELLLALLGAAVNVGANVVPLSILRADQRLRSFLGFSTIATLSNVGLSLLFVAAFRWGILGWLVATMVANVVTLATGVLIVPFRRPQAVDVGLIRQLLRLGIPLVPHMFAQWALQVADRIVIAGIVSASALGVYSLASNIGLPVLMLVQSVNYGFMPTYARAGAGNATREELEKTVLMQATTVAFVSMAVALLAPPFLGIVAASSYGQAGSLVPWIALGYAFFGLYCIPMNGLTLGAGQTKYVPVVSLCGAIANIGLLYLLVPSGGIRAAAIAAAGAYGVLLIGVFVYAWRPANPVRYRWGQLAGVFAAVLGVYALGRLTSTDAGGSLSLLIRSVWLCAAFSLVLAMSSRVRHRICESLRNLRGVVSTP